MAKRTANYNFYSLEFGDKWYAGLDFENFTTVENQFEYLQNFIGPCIISGWTVEKLSNNRSDQLLLLGEYLKNQNSEYGVKLKSLNLNFMSEYICAAGTTSNINLSGGAPNLIDGVSLSVNDKILVKDQTVKSQNGIYNVVTLGTGINGTWTRSGILDSSGDFNSNFIVYVQSGISNTSTLWLGASLGTTFGTNSIYFINPFEQCIKVSEGAGIVDKYYGKTEKPNYFRFTNNDYAYIWADKTLNITYNNLAKISAPLPAYIKYGKENKAAYLAKVSSSSGSTLYDAVTIDEIYYGVERKDYNSSTGDFQSNLNFNLLKHKHLGNLYTAEKINLNNSLILSAKNIYNNSSKQSSTVFALYNPDGTLFDIANLNNYGIPKVYLNSTILSESDYKFASTNKLYLKNSISINDVVSVFLPTYSQKELFCIDSSGSSLGGTLSTNYVYLTDGVREDRTPDDNTVNLVYKNFSWNNHNYLPAKVYINNSEIDEKYYTLNADTGKIKFSSTYPTLALDTYENVSVKIDYIGNEIQNKLSGEKIQDINASDFTRGAIGISSVRNLSHNYYSRHRESAQFKFSKYLIAGNGNSYFYAENTNSDLQFNTEIYYISQTNNFNNQTILYGTAQGLMSSNDSFKNIKIDSSWINDSSSPILILDDVLRPENFNQFKTTYILVKSGKILYKKQEELNWTEVTLPSISSGIALTASTFEVSTDKISGNDGSESYSSYAYVGVSSGVYFANFTNISDNFDWKKIDVYDSTKISELKNINTIKELCTKNTHIATSLPDTITYDRSIYVASSDDTYPGLYYGNEAYIKRITTDSVNGITVITEGENNFNNNSVIWWDDYDAYITHSSHYYDGTIDKYWDHPFSIDAESYTSCSCATTENIVLSGLQTIDGYTTNPGDRVLVKNQTSSIQNGIYVASSSSWSRANDLNSNSEFIYGKRVEILNGSLQSDSIWFLRYSESYILGSTNIIWDIYKFKIYSTSTPPYSAERPKIKNVIYRNSNLLNQQYLVIHDYGVALITDESLPSIQELNYEKPYQGKIHNALSLKSTNANGLLYLATEYGLYVSTDYFWFDTNLLTDISLLKYSWSRTENMFLKNDSIKIFNIETENENTSFESFYQWQMIKFNSDITTGTNYYYERSFTDFYIDPWIDDFLDNNNTQTDYNIIVYIGNKPSSIPFYTNPETGLIKFVSSVPSNFINEVYVSLSKNNPFILNSGSKTHEELFLSANKYKSIAKLFVENNPTNNIIYLNQTISVDEKVLLLQNENYKEIVYIESINNYKSPVEVELVATRNNYNSTFTFPIGTEVFSLKDSLSENILDDLYYLISKEKYNLGSLNNANTGLLTLALDNEIPGIFDQLPSALFQQNDSRGLKNLLNINDFLNSNYYDSGKSLALYNIGSPADSEIESFDVTNIFDVENLSKNSSDMLCITDRGFWKNNSARWINTFRFDKINCNFIKQKSDKSFVVGTSNGLYNISKNYSVSKNSIYTQEIFDYLDGVYEGAKFEAYAKSDGFVLIKNPTDINFISEYSDLLDSNRVFGISLNKALRVSDDKFSAYDIFYLSSESGFYGMCSGSNSDFFGTSLITRKLIESNPEGVTKYFKSFVPYQIPTIPSNSNQNSTMFILTNDGLLKINNYKWCDPLIENQYLNIDSRHLRNLECTCYVLDKEDSPDNLKPGKSKIFIGTNKGVYRSLNGGESFEKTERIKNRYLKINSLKIFESTFLSGANNITKNVIVASTELGIFYTIDDGDNWYEINEPTEDSEQPISAQYFPTDRINVSDDKTSGNYLGQTFTANKTATIDKISVYLKVNNQLLEDENYSISLSSNSVNAYLYGVDGNGIPNLSNLLATSTSNPKTPNDLLNEEYSVFEFNYNINQNTKVAIVIREVLTSGGISVVQWVKSPINNSEINGQAYTRYDGSFVALDSGYNDSNQYQYHFRIIYNLQNQAQENEIAVGKNTANSLGWNSGNLNGVIVNDSGNLTLDTNFLISLVVDDTVSMSSNTNTDYASKTELLLNYLISRSKKTYSPVDLEFTGIDFWILSDGLYRKTSGFVNDSTATLSNIQNLKKDGTYNDLLSALDLASIGLYRISVNEMFKKTNDDEGNQDRIQNIVSYLTSISSLRLTDLISDYNNLSQNDGWDLTANNIYQSDLASNLLLDRFAKTYIPILVCITDGENRSDTNFDDIIENCQNYWNDQGFKLLIFDLSKSNLQGKFNKLSSEDNGYHFQINTNSNWDDAITSLLHNGSKNLFKGFWTKTYNYSESKFIDRVYCEFTNVGFSSTLIEYRYSKDSINYSDWIEIESGVSSSLKKKVYSIEYKITLTQGWNGSIISNPIVNRLYHVEVNPAELYLFSNDIATVGYINELILTPQISNDKNLEISWGISKDSTNKWKNYSFVPAYRNGVLSNRQKIYRSTKEQNYTELSLQQANSDFYKFYIQRDNSIFKWSDNYEIIVKLNDLAISSNLYRVDNNTGVIIFDNAQESYLSITVDIKELKEIYLGFGENTYTTDYKTYYAENGSWFDNNKIVVYVNNVIQRKDFILDKYTGSISFKKYLTSSDIVSLYVDHDNNFKIGVKILDYTLPTNDDIYNFSIQYTTLNNLNKLSESKSVTKPYLLENRALILSESSNDNNEITLKSPMILNYTYISDYGTEERESKTSWWIKKGSFFQQIDGVPNYTNRTIQRKKDLNESNNYFEENDEIYIQVQPIDQYKFGNSYQTEIYTIKSFNKPYVSDVKIRSSNTIILSNVKSGEELNAFYNYTDIDNNTDESLVYWYDWSKSTKYIYTGVNLPKEYVTAGSVISFIVKPYNGDVYGNSIESNSIIVT